MGLVTGPGVEGCYITPMLHHTCSRQCLLYCLRVWLLVFAGVCLQQGM
jgi:hypothetical protein